MTVASVPVNPSSGVSLSERIERRLLEAQDRVLLRDEHVQLRGADLMRAGVALAEFLDRMSTSEGKVGIVFENTAARGWAILATLRAGRCPVILDAAECATELPTKVERYRLQAVLRSETLALPEQACAPEAFLDASGFLSRVRGERAARSALPETRARAGTAMILYTSGSMGEPKGVEVPERGILETCDTLIDRFALGTHTRAPILLPVCHSMAINTQFLPTFLAGGVAEFFKSQSCLNRIYRKLLASEGDFIALIGEMLRICWDEHARRGLPPHVHARHVQLAGGQITAEHLRMARELFPNARIHKGYGLTEAIRVSMIDDRDPLFFERVAGRALPGVKIEIRDPEGSVLPPGELGQIHVRSSSVLLGYSGQPHSPVGHDGFLPTGDLGRLDADGILRVEGRADGVFKVNGEKVSALEIETLARESAPHVRDVKCLPIVPESESARARVVLFLEIESDQQEEFLSRESAQFERAFRKRLEMHKYIPREIVVLNRFPRTPNGKLRSGSLKELARASERLRTWERAEQTLFKILKAEALQ